MKSYNDHLNDYPQSETQVITKRKDGTIRVQTIFTAPSLTDQSMAKATNINNILKQYTAQGLTPQINNDPRLFRDVSNLPSIEAAHDIVNQAREAFLTLPATIRKLMDNDPSKAESFISNPDNRDLLIKYGVLEKKQKKVETLPKSDPPPVGKKESKDSPKKDD